MTPITASPTLFAAEHDRVKVIAYYKALNRGGRSSRPTIKL